MLAIAFVFALAAQLGTSNLGTIEGSVVKLGTNDPVSGADVELTRLAGTPDYPLGEPAYPPGTFSVGAIVSRTAPNRADAFSARTKDDGRFAFKDLKPGTYRLRTARAGGAYLPAEYGQKNPRGPGLDLPLGERQIATGIRLEMAATGSISGRVMDENGIAMGRVRVLALESSYDANQAGRRVWNLVQSMETDDRGEYRLFWLPPGKYYIAARPNDLKGRLALQTILPPGIRATPGAGPLRESFTQAPLMRRALSNGDVIEETYELAYHGGGTDPRRALPVELPAGANLNGIDISLADSRVRARRISGAVVDASGRPPVSTDGEGKPAYVTVRAIPVAPGPSTVAPTATADANGRFEIIGAGPGPYLLRATMPGVTPGNALAGLASLGPGTANAENVRIVMTPGFTIPGRIVVEGQNANSVASSIEAIRISLIPDNYFAAAPRIAVSRDSTFIASGVQPTDYQAAVALNGDAYVKSMRLGALDVLRDGLRIGNAPEDELQLVIGTDGGRLEGRIVNDRSLPLANATVVLVPDPAPGLRADLYKTAQTDAAGLFRVRGIAPGNYKVFAWQYVENGIWLDPDFQATQGNRGKSVRIVEGSNPAMDLTAIPE